MYFLIILQRGIFTPKYFELMRNASYEIIIKILPNNDKIQYLVWNLLNKKITIINRKIVNNGKYKNKNRNFEKLFIETDL